MYSGIFISFHSKYASFDLTYQFLDPLISNPQFLLTPLPKDTELNDLYEF